MPGKICTTIDSSRHQSFQSQFFFWPPLRSTESEFVLTFASIRSQIVAFSLGVRTPRDRTYFSSTDQGHRRQTICIPRSSIGDSQREVLVDLSNFVHRLTPRLCLARRTVSETRVLRTTAYLLHPSLWCTRHRRSAIP